jgi:2OG-Fe(II) oxygenase superfamily
MVEYMSNWITKELRPLTEENLDLLIDHKIPAILEENFIPLEICEAVAERLKSMEFSNYDHLNEIPVFQVGLCHNQWAHDDKSIYFNKRDDANKIIEDIYRDLDINPVQLVLDAIERKGKRQANIFHEKGYGAYFAGAFRSFKGHGRLHADHAPSHIHKEWAVTHIRNQLTWNIYYCTQQDGGELLIYDTIHTSQNDKMKVPGEYYFPYEVLEREDHVRIKPKVGDFIMFNTQNFHEVLGSKEGHRISQTSFVGLRNDGSIGIWS